MLGNAEPTPFDLNFSLFGIPVRVHPFFWIAGAIMGWSARSPHLVVLWIVCLFVSILVHEMGHALMARAFGWPVHVVLYSFGGYAQYQPFRGYTSSRAIQVALAGPAAGFILFGIIRLALMQAALWGHPAEALPINVRFVILQMEWINLWWGLVNLLPVFPLDGGQVARHVFLIFWPRRGDEFAFKLAIVVGAIAAIFFFRIGQEMAALLFAILTLENIFRLQGRSFM